MLFEGFSLHLTAVPDNIEGHPFHAANDIGITSIADYQVLPIASRVEAFQLAYIRKVIDTVHDLPNVLFEVANESSGRPRIRLYSKTDPRSTHRSVIPHSGSTG